MQYDRLRLPHQIDTFLGFAGGLVCSRKDEIGPLVTRYRIEGYVCHQNIQQFDRLLVHPLTSQALGRVAEDVSIVVHHPPDVLVVVNVRIIQIAEAEIEKALGGDARLHAPEWFIVPDGYDPESLPLDLEEVLEVQLSIGTDRHGKINRPLPSLMGIGGDDIERGLIGGI